MAEMQPTGNDGGAQPGMASMFEKEKNDPAMIAYLKALGIDPNYDPPKDDNRRVVVSKLEIIFKDHPADVLNVETDASVKKAKEKPLVIKEGAQYKIRVYFRVQHQVVAGLKICSTVSKMGKKLPTETEMLGSYAPKNEFTSVDIGGGDFVEAPTGMMARGDYKAHMKFMDDDNQCHLDFEYAIKITKDWKGE